MFHALKMKRIHKLLYPFIYLVEIYMYIYTKSKTTKKQIETLNENSELKDSNKIMVKSKA